MYEFWYFGFVTAKHWGHGPKRWTAHDLWRDFQSAASPALLPPTPPAHSANIHPQSSELEPHTTTQAWMPSPLCRWSIHIDMDEHGHIERLGEDAQEDPGDPLSQPWPESWCTEPLGDKLQVGLESNSFSTVQAAQLPIDLGIISQAARKSEDQVWREGLGFAIMGRNFDLLKRMLRPESHEDRMKLSTRDIQGIHPAHLAATYLDGGKTCCQIMRLLCYNLSGPGHGLTDRDSKGHTVFDALMLRILRSHSDTPLEVVDNNLKGVRGHAGEESDICGRWDAETDSYRRLVGGGSSKVPLSWKHKFCHTSVQAICHCIKILSEYPQPATSGLFLRHCPDDKRTLELSTPHAMVLTALQLLKHGLDGEDLFGMICSLFQLTVSGANGSVDFSRSLVSIHLLQEGVNHAGCIHEAEALTPFELAMRVDVIARQCGSLEARKGWTAFVLVLERIEEQHRWVSEGHPPPGYEDVHQAIRQKYEDQNDIFDDGLELDESLLTQEIFFDDELDFPSACFHMEFSNNNRAFGRNIYLGHIWAACQAELLTYRRQQESHPWLSQHLSIDAILHCLRTEDPNALPHVKNDMLKPYCACGLYPGDYELTLREDACTSYFSNLDDWHRTSFIPVVDDD
jgi:hypothetical protein